MVKKSHNKNEQFQNIFRRKTLAPIGTASKTTTDYHASIITISRIFQPFFRLPLPGFSILLYSKISTFQALDASN